MVGPRQLGRLIRNERQTMRATIEIGNRPEVFWRVALAMCEEHLGYYARENGFRANIQMMRALVDAHNGGNPQALHYGAMAAVGGLQPAVAAAVAEAIDEDVAKPAAAWGSLDFINGSGENGFWMAIDPDKDGSLYASWKTSGGNFLSIRLQGRWVWVTVDGRRHGIPWRFLDNCGLNESDLLVIGQESESNTKPWETGMGEPIWRCQPGKPEVFVGYPTELAKPLEEYPDWGSYHQQAGWAADRVYTWSKLGGLLRCCAALAVDSSALVEKEERIWPRNVLPALDWSVIRKSWQRSDP